MDNNKNSTPKNNSTNQILPFGSGGGVELRSEKVRNIIGKIPSVLVRYGTVLIGLVLLIILIVSAFVPYRETIPVKITVEGTASVLFGKAAVSKTQLAKISLGNKLIINDPLLGFVEAKVAQVLPEPLPDDGFMREIIVTFAQQPASKSFAAGDIMEGQIVLSDIPVLKKFLQSLGIR